jgi:hypothetical protein
MTNPEDIAAQRWYAVIDDMSALGSWCVMNVAKSPVQSDPATGELQIARYLSEAAAHQIAEHHNAGLAGKPWTRPERYRVRAEDALIFDDLGETIARAEGLLGAEAGGEIRQLRAVLGEVLGALNLLTEGAIRLRAEA